MVDNSDIKPVTLRRQKIDASKTSPNHRTAPHEIENMTLKCRENRDEAEMPLLDEQEAEVKISPEIKNGSKQIAPQDRNGRKKVLPAKGKYE